MSSGIQPWNKGASECSESEEFVLPVGSSGSSVFSRLEREGGKEEREKDK